MGKCNQTFKAGVPNLWDPMPDDLRWNCCSNNRNEAHNKCNVLEITPKPYPSHPSRSTEKLSSTKTVPGAKKVGDY